MERPTSKEIQEAIKQDCLNDIILRIAEYEGDRWKGALELMAEGPCDGCPGCARIAEETKAYDEE